MKRFLITLAICLPITLVGRGIDQALRIAPHLELFAYMFSGMILQARHGSAFIGQASGNSPHQDTDSQSAISAGDSASIHNGANT